MEATKLADMIKAATGLIIEGGFTEIRREMETEIVFTGVYDTNRIGVQAIANHIVAMNEIFSNLAGSWVSVKEIMVFPTTHSSYQNQYSTAVEVRVSIIPLLGKKES